MRERHTKVKRLRTRNLNCRFSTHPTSKNEINHFSIPVEADESTSMQVARSQVGLLPVLGASGQLFLLLEEHEKHCMKQLMRSTFRDNDKTKIIFLELNKTEQNEHSNLPGRALKSPHTSIGMSALTAIFSSPFNSVCTYTQGMWINSLRYLQLS